MEKRPSEDFGKAGVGERRAILSSLRSLEDFGTIGAFLLGADLTAGLQQSKSEYAIGAPSNEPS